jgi:hypothetical protein
MKVEVSTTGRSADKTLYDILIETQITQSVIEDHKTQRRKDLTWIDKQNNRVLDKLFIDELSASCLDGKSEFLTKQVKDKGADKYSFMLNWIILIAFHLYHIATDQTKQTLLEACGELIEHMYYTFIWWMKHADAIALHNAFKTGQETYEVKVKKLINSGITGDQTLRILVNKIKRFLCVNDKKTYNDVERAASPPKNRPVDIRPTSSGHPISPASTRASATNGNINSRPVSQIISDRVNMFDNLATQGPALIPKPSSSSASGQLQPSSPRQLLSSPSSSSNIRPLSASTTVSGTSQIPAHVRHSTSNPLQPFFTQSDVPAGSSDSNDWVLQDMNQEIPAAKPQNNTEFTNARGEKPQKTPVSIYDESRMRQLRLNTLKRQQEQLEERNTYLNRGGYSQGGKPRTRKHNSAKPRTTTIRKRSKHPVNQRRKYTRKARQDCVSGSTKRTKRVKNNLG